MRDVTRRLLSHLRGEGGFSLAEMSVTSMVAAIALTALAAFLVNSIETSAFTEGQSRTINDARNAIQRIEKEVRGADSIAWCPPVGSCLVVGAQTPTGAFRTVRYTHAESKLFREVFDPASSIWGVREAVVERITNTPVQPVFACDTQSTLLRVDIDLHIEPTPQSNPNYNIHTSIRPRNFPSVATCP